MNLFYYLSAFGIGAMHALEPGHGKSIMGAYLVLSRGRIVDAIVLGLTSAVTHTLVIVFMAVAAKFATAQVITSVPYTDRPELWLRLVSGLLIVIVGIRLLPIKRRTTCSCGHHHSGHHRHPVPGANNARRVNLTDLILVGFTNGLIPCPSALAVLLLSLSTGQLLSGLSLVFAFGIGGAVALITIGIVFVKISSCAGNRINTHTWSRLAAASGLLIIFTGVVVIYRAVQGLL
ncbi:HoxN/HupN/NixA family nickel/cobalt transporter [Desulfolucanica intricata]|uniref:HoxN/HupN/NixA family nickel/cobalt transporter n=1 Tax=Desulfolucanica intricata TaxID=1285191 RepID=UPI0008378B9B|nr:sulfite exporter TauE/SafE family protein [Desulfolucanica intricata]